MKLLILFFLLCLPAPALGAGQDYGAFSADLPQGWSHSQEDGMHFFVAADRSCALLVAMEHAQGAQIEDLAIALSRRLQGDTPQPGEEDDIVFSFVTPKGVRAQSTLRPQGQHFVLITSSGQCPAQAALLRSITLPPATGATPTVPPAAISP